MSSRAYRPAMVALALWLALAAPVHAAWEDYLIEDFDTSKPMFPVGTFGEASYTVDNEGRYIINGMDSDRDSLSVLKDHAAFYRLSTDCQILSSINGELAFCGIMFHYNKGADGLTNYYVFYVYGDGFYGVKRILGEQTDILVPLTQTDRLDSSAPNTLAVEASGNRFELFINGESVNSFSDVRIDEGGYGFYISKHSIGAFDDFRVQVEPQQAPARESGGTNAPDRPERGGGGHKRLVIPKDPNRPLYPWEVGYEKDPKKKKQRLEAERRGDKPSAGSKASKPAGKKTQPGSKAGTSQRQGDLQRNTRSRSGKQADSFVPDEEPEAKGPLPPSLRRQERDPDPEPRDAQPEEDYPAPDEAAQPLPQPDLELPALEDEPLRMDDEPVTDDVDEDVPEVQTERHGVTLEDLEDSDEAQLYRRAPEFEDAPAENESPREGFERTTGEERLEGNPELEAAVPEADAAADAEAEREAAAAEPEDGTVEQRRRRGIDLNADDWDAPRAQYDPDRRLPPSERIENRDEPAETGDAVVERHAEMADEESTEVQLGAPAADEAAAAEPERPVRRPVVDEPAYTPKNDPVELPEVEPSRELPEPGLARPGLTTLTDDFSAQRWQTKRDISVIEYADEQYVIDNTRAESMAISYQQEAFGDSELSVDVEYTAGPSYVGYGVASRFILDGNAVSYYGLFISRSGEYMLLKVIDGAEFVLKDWSASPLLSAEGVNRIGLRIEGDRITALLNSEAAATVRDTDIANGRYALLVGPGTGARFDNLTLTGDPVE